MSRYPYLLVLTAVGAGLSVVAQGVALTTEAADKPAQTRMGMSIQESMADRDKKMAEEKRALEMREQAIQSLEASMGGDKPGGKAGDGSADAGPDENAERYDNLARIYQSMKPAKAAIVLEKLDLEVQMKVAQRMRERSLALVLAGMTPDGAATLSMSLAAGRPIPKEVPAPPAEEPKPAKNAEDAPLADEGADLDMEPKPEPAKPTPPKPAAAPAAKPVAVAQPPVKQAAPVAAPAKPTVAASPAPAVKPPAPAASAAAAVTPPAAPQLHPVPQPAVPSANAPTPLVPQQVQQALQGKE